MRKPSLTPPGRMAVPKVRAFIDFTENPIGAINAQNIKRSHALIESGRAKGKIVLEGFLPPTDRPDRKSAQAQPAK